MAKLKDAELVALGVEKRPGATFQTDLLDVHPARYEVIALLHDGVIVRRLAWVEPPEARSTKK